MANAQQAFAALSDPTRAQVFQRLQSGGVSVGEIARHLPVSRPAVSQHLKVLKEAGLVTSHADGTRRVYSIDPHGLGAIRAWLDQFWSTALDAFAAEVERQQLEGKRELAGKKELARKMTARAGKK